MTRIAPRSSTIASASRNTFSGNGARLPSNASTPSANAISVAIGMPQPWAPRPPKFHAVKMSAGTSIPPNAAATGNIALRGDASSPLSSSRLISSPTTKKKTAMSASLTNCSRSIRSAMRANSNEKCRAHSSVYWLPHGEFAHTRAAIVAASSTTPPDASVATNAWIGWISALATNERSAPFGSSPGTGAPLKPCPEHSAAGEAIASLDDYALANRHARHAQTTAALRYPAPMPGLSFRPLVRDDFAMLSRWLAEPHVAKWWCSPSDMAYIEHEYGPAIDGADPTELFVLQREDQPIGLFQRYLLDDYPDWAAAVGFTGAAAIDYLIGEPALVGQGLGSRAIRLFTA